MARFRSCSPVYKENKETAAKRSRTRPIIGSAGKGAGKKAPDGPGYRERLAAEAIARYDAVADRLVIAVQERHPRPVTRSQAATILGETPAVIGKAMQRAEARALLTRRGKQGGYVLPAAPVTHA